MKIKNIAKLIILILICQMAGFFGSIFTSASIPTWYATLEKPFFTPPNWLFVPVWLSLYTLMGISLYIILEKRSKKSKTALSIFGIQLFLNAIWSYIFFGLKSPFYAFIEIIILYIVILIKIIKFYQISKKAGLLLIPYIIWVTIATFLNFYIWILN